MFDPGTKCLTEFIEKMDGPHDPKVWATLVEEEAAEVVEATANLLKELTDLYYVATGAMVTNTDSLGDWQASPAVKLATLIQMAMAPVFGPDIMCAALTEVHRSNMSKLGDDGKPLRREDGKVLKGPNYSPADMVAVLNKWADDLPL